MATLKEVFVELACANIAEDPDVSGEKWQFLAVMNEYDDYFTVRRATKEETLKRSYRLVKALFPFLYPELGGSRSDYLSSAIANALYDNGLSLTVAVPKEVQFAWNRMIYERAVNYERVVNELRNAGFDLKRRRD